MRFGAKRVDVGIVNPILPKSTKKWRSTVALRNFCETLTVEIAVGDFVTCGFANHCQVGHSPAVSEVDFFSQNDGWPPPKGRFRTNPPSERAAAIPNADAVGTSSSFCPNPRHRSDGASAPPPACRHRRLWFCSLHRHEANPVQRLLAIRFNESEFTVKPHSVRRRVHGRLDAGAALHAG